MLWKTQVTTSELEQYSNIILCGNSETATVFKTPRKRTKVAGKLCCSMLYTLGSQGSCVNTAPPPSSPATGSFLSRIVAALTPVSSRHMKACDISTLDTSTSEFETPNTQCSKSRNRVGFASEDLRHSVSLSTRKRKRDNEENYDPDFNIEMKEFKRKRPLSPFKTESPLFSPSLSIPQSFCFTPTESSGVLVCETPSSKLAVSPQIQSQMSSPLRRSERVAQRKRGQMLAGGMKSLTSPHSLLSAVSLYIIFH